jgi:TonB family protein
MEPIQKQLILEHEMVHIDQRHSYDLLLFELLKVIFWYNPVVWLLQREISQVHEFIADDVVVNDRNRDLYLETLAQRTLYQLQIPWATNFNFNNNLILNRITMIQSHARNTRLWKYGILLGLYVFLHVLVACTDEQPIGDNTPNEVYNMVDERPAPTNGMEGFYQELAGVLKYPKQARTMGIEGKVYLSFVVQETGELTDITVLKGIGAGCDIAAKEALSNVSNWSPGTLNGKPVKVQLTLPVVFKLTPDNTTGDNGQG